VTTSVPPAEIGRAGGAVINTSFTSGTNQFHGSGYYYGQNSALNAYHPILKRNRAEAIARNDINIPVKAVQQIHEFGGTVGGPSSRTGPSSSLIISAGGTICRLRCPQLFLRRTFVTESLALPIPVPETAAGA